MKKINELFNSPIENSQVLEPSSDSMSAEGETNSDSRQDIILMDVDDKKDLGQR